MHMDNLKTGCIFNDFFPPCFNGQHFFGMQELSAKKVIVLFSFCIVHFTFNGK